ncbi:hypothetical protein [Natronoglycomyces albus]|uniref:Uncharacterized protein n=1 Tax=Natronoglycomyces albus TaxID=2811108 RepID=A0A895XLP9_9ACTN|nr:hypothetical protein [Natronoglycomyces albus]QSB06007.1 hypothetical protein JQS30_03530 [Natronoglycomyces albus]
MRTRTRVIAISTVALLAATGCQSESDEPERWAERPTEISVTDEEAEHFIANWVENIRLRFELTTVRQRLEVECMNQHGFTVHPDQQTWPTDRDEILGKQFGVLAGPNPINAGELGYGDMIQRPFAATGIPNMSDFDRLSVDESQAYYRQLWGESAFDDDHDDTLTVGGDQGSSEIRYRLTGCEGAVYEALYEEDLRSFLSLKSAASASGGFFVDEYDEVKEANFAWVTCMESAGFTGVTEPSHTRDIAIDLWLDLDSDHLGSNPSPADVDATMRAEVELATTDLACVEETDLNPLRLRAWAQGIMLSSEALEVDFFQFREQAEAYLVKAQTLLESYDFT